MRHALKLPALATLTTASVSDRVSELGNGQCSTNISYTAKNNSSKGFCHACYCTPSTSIKSTEAPIGLTGSAARRTITPKPLPHNPASASGVSVIRYGFTRSAQTNSGWAREVCSMRTYRQFRLRDMRTVQVFVGAQHFNK